MTPNSKQLLSLKYDSLIHLVPTHPCGLPLSLVSGLFFLDFLLWLRKHMYVIFLFSLSPQKTEYYIYPFAVCFFTHKIYPGHFMNIVWTFVWTLYEHLVCLQNFAITKNAAVNEWPCITLCCCRCISRANS